MPVRNRIATKEKSKVVPASRSRGLVQRLPKTMVWLDGRRKDLHLDREPWPYVGAAVAGGAAVALAVVVGAGELMIGAAATYAAYRVLRDGISPKAAILEETRLEQGKSSH